MRATVTLPPDVVGWHVPEGYTGPALIVAENGDSVDVQWVGGPGDGEVEPVDWEYVTASKTVAALYVQPDGIYSKLPGVEPWGLPDRDARDYSGPWPIVAHPPCAAWGRYAKPTPASLARGPLRGDDAGCFAAALASVRQWGGVIEHPRDSKAWAAHGLGAPGPRGWARILAGGWTCRVEQGHYGHLARKPTWLYWCGDGEPPPLVWGPSTVAPHPTSARRGVLETMGQRERAATPLNFAKALVRLAQLARSD